MRRSLKVKSLATRPLRKTAKSDVMISRRPFPAWIDDDAGAAFSVRSVSNRVRDGLVLREVAKKKKSGAKAVHHARSVR